jgi:hypothetical protein
MRRKGALAWLAFSLLLAGASPPARAELRLRPEGEIGHLYSWLTESGSREYSRPYALARLRADGELFTLEAAGRAWPGRWEARTALVRLNQETWSLTAGLQDVPWGETFGIFIADLVNPRDLSDPLLNDLGWIRKPVGAAQLKLGFDRWSFQLVLTPVARSNDPPASLVAPGIAILGARRDGGALGDAELGGRLGCRLESGLDLSAYALTHFNRNIVFEPVAGQGLRPLEKRVTSLGSSFSQASEAWVLRGDAVVHLDQPQPQENLSVPPLRDQFQSILGADYATPERLSLGFQHHFEWAGTPEHWLSARVAGSLLSGRLEPELFGFAGLGNPDVWLQPRLTWNVSSGVRWSIRADLLDGSRIRPLTEGLLGSLRTRDRILSWISWAF